MVTVASLSIRHRQKATLAKPWSEKEHTGREFGWLWALSGGQRTKSEPGAVSPGPAQAAITVTSPTPTPDSPISSIYCITRSRVKVMGRATRWPAGVGSRLGFMTGEWEDCLLPFVVEDAAL